MRRRKPGRAALYEDPAFVALLGRIAANVRVRRDALGVTQEELARRCEVRLSVIREVERAATNVTALTLLRLCRGLGVDAADLFTPTAPRPKRRPGRPRKEDAAATGAVRVEEDSAGG